ncbi:metallophosphoesterase [Pseudomonas sp. gcc21]|uniref:metallophosphoesterase family protein n=1 Tax=Pseudomonas sp. gcc21 TaxID=2726989 RepID=UPI0014516BEA|nr:metallophosphoesterase [Pseudomonas sp. gcc21]QJD59361.1 metallophosphoesterase [Pseudomonas sp. gcc21]
MTRVLQLSDPHFGTEQLHVVDALHRFIDTCAPDVLLLSGDITQRARRHQFDAAQRFLDKITCPVLAVPGNHDIPLFNLFARFINPYGNFQRAFGKQLEPEFANSDVLILGVNTTRASRHKDGEVSASQTARVIERLRQAKPDQLRIVMQHHPVRAVAESDTANLLIGRERAIPAWVDAGMDLLLGGHIHLPYVWPVYGQAGETGRKAWTVQAGTAMSSRTRGQVPNSVNLIQHEYAAGRHRCTVERWDYSLEAQSFVQALVTDVTPDRPALKSALD